MSMYIDPTRGWKKLRAGVIVIVLLFIVLAFFFGRLMR